MAKNYLHYILICILLVNVPLNNSKKDVKPLVKELFNILLESLPDNSIEDSKSEDYLEVKDDYLPNLKLSNNFLKVGNLKDNVLNNKISVARNSLNMLGDNNKNELDNTTLSKKLNIFEKSNENDNIEDLKSDLTYISKNITKDVTNSTTATIKDKVISYNYADKNLELQNKESEFKISKIISRKAEVDIEKSILSIYLEIAGTGLNSKTILALKKWDESFSEYNVNLLCSSPNVITTVFARPEKVEPHYILKSQVIKFNIKHNIKTLQGETFFLCISESITSSNSQYITKLTISKYSVPESYEKEAFRNDYLFELFKELKIPQFSFFFEYPFEGYSDIILKLEIPSKISCSDFRIDVLNFNSKKFESSGNTLHPDKTMGILNKTFISSIYNEVPNLDSKYFNFKEVSPSLDIVSTAKLISDNNKNKSTKICLWNISPLNFKKQILDALDIYLKYGESSRIKIGDILINKIASNDRQSTLLGNAITLALSLLPIMLAIYSIIFIVLNTSNFYLKIYGNKSQILLKTLYSTFWCNMERFEPNKNLIYNKFNNFNLKSTNRKFLFSKNLKFSNEKGRIENWYITETNKNVKSDQSKVLIGCNSTEKQLSCLTNNSFKYSDFPCINTRPITSSTDSSQSKEYASNEDPLKYLESDESISIYSGI
ncbi:uncharacterized protein CMU_037820 [Cryptosporidium muris RN66]|uniref:Uncharacterized protein n=1 Tax=Cryptosporidium muris (strain RN66) TaxID=441375 RepID=B6A926_CRYMR|nr:uncharacterized protein CMU_037820 [Cryptosporidium muris RN66]EEA04717.1 hypothetical protein, conserved [Cryptosporidium muris RN66]|eukprot:XP_002139066.1 hypothetical protein [Cryptosporidium muris RN66]